MFTVESHVLSNFNTRQKTRDQKCCRSVGHPVPIPFPPRRWSVSISAPKISAPFGWAPRLSGPQHKFFAMPMLDWTTYTLKQVTMVTVNLWHVVRHTLSPVHDALIQWRSHPVWTCHHGCQSADSWPDVSDRHSELLNHLHRNNHQCSMHNGMTVKTRVTYTASGLHVRAGKTCFFKKSF